MSAQKASSPLVEKDRAAGGAFPPAAAAVTPPASEIEQKRPLTFEEAGQTPDPREASEKVEIRYPDPISKALGCPLFITNWDEVGWHLASGQKFSVTRYYRPIKVAVDLPRNEAEMELVEHKRTTLRKLGIAYVYIAPNKAKSAAELKVEIDQERKLFGEEDS